MIVRLTSFTSSRLLITKSANLAIVLASDFHWYIVRPTKKQNQFCTCSSWTDMTRISADFCQHVWWLPLAFEWSYVPWCFTLSFQCQIMMIATANLRVLPVFECLLKTRGKNFPKTHHLSFFAYSKSYYKHYPTALQRHLIFLKKLTAQVKISHFYLFFQFFTQ